MASFTCTIAFALDIAQRLAAANIPFNLDAQNQHACTVVCKFEETLQCVVDQLNGQHLPINRNSPQATTEVHCTGHVDYDPASRIRPTDADYAGFPPLRDGKPFDPEAARLPFGGPPTDVVLVREAWDNLNDWQDATHQVTFDNGKNWTNVKLKYGYYIACSDSKRSWRVSTVNAANVVKRPVNQAQPGKRIPMLYSDPVHQERYDRGVCVSCGNMPGPCSLCGGIE